jgi:hypothetical protein
MSPILGFEHSAVEARARRASKGDGTGKNIISGVARVPMRTAAARPASSAPAGQPASFPRRGGDLMTRGKIKGRTFSLSLLAAALSLSAGACGNQEAAAADDGAAADKPFEGSWGVTIGMRAELLRSEGFELSNDPDYDADLFPDKPPTVIWESKRHPYFDFIDAYAYKNSGRVYSVQAGKWFSQTSGHEISPQCAELMDSAASEITKMAPNLKVRKSTLHGDWPRMFWEIRKEPNGRAFHLSCDHHSFMIDLLAGPDEDDALAKS